MANRLKRGIVNHQDLEEGPNHGARQHHPEKDRHPLCRWPRLRFDYHWRRYFRPVPTLPPAPAGPEGASVRDGHRRWRHLVLEPLSRLPFRLRKLFLRLFLEPGNSGRVGLDRALLAAAGNGEVPELRRRQVRSAQGYPVLSPCGQGALSGRHQVLESHAGRWRRAHLPLAGDGDRPSLRPYLPANQGPRPL